MKVSTWGLFLHVSNVASPAASTIRSGPPLGPQSRALSVHHQYSCSVSPFQTNTAQLSRAMAAATWSCVEKMLQEQHLTSAPRAVSVSMSTAVWMVMWSDCVIREPLKGCAGPNSDLQAINPGISTSANSSSSGFHSTAISDHHNTHKHQPEPCFRSSTMQI